MASQTQSPKATPMPLQTLETVKARLNAAKGTSGTWEAVAAEFGISIGTAVRVAGGYEPRTEKVRAALGLPPMELTAVCPVHGVVHVTGCPKARTIAPAWVSTAAAWLAPRETTAPDAVRVYGRNGGKIGRVVVR